MKTHYRTIWISDTHLGSRLLSQPELLCDFLKHNESDFLYLVGDFIDGWALKRGRYFPESHMEVLRKVLKRAHKGTKVTYIVGNHDDLLRKFLPIVLGNIDVLDEKIHHTADGRSLLVIHGDCFDQVVKYAKFVAVLGDIGYTILLGSNKFVNAVRSRFGFFEYWSLSAFVKNKVKGAVNFISGYEQAVIKAAKNLNVDGVICGHIHHPEISVDDIIYMNCGDFVESYSALVEHDDGTIELLRIGYDSTGKLETTVMKTLEPHTQVTKELVSGLVP